MKNSLRLILESYNFKNVKVNNLYYLPFTWRFPKFKFICWIIRNLFPYPYIENFTNPIWKLVRFSNEVQIIGYGKK